MFWMTWFLHMTFEICDEKIIYVHDEEKKQEMYNVSCYFCLHQMKTSVAALCGQNGGGKMVGRQYK